MKICATTEQQRCKCQELYAVSQRPSFLPDFPARDDNNNSIDDCKEYGSLFAEPLSFDYCLRKGYLAQSPTTTPPPSSQEDGHDSSRLRHHPHHYSGSEKRRLAGQPAIDAMARRKKQTTTTVATIPFKGKEEEHGCCQGYVLAIVVVLFVAVAMITAIVMRMPQPLVSSSFLVSKHRFYSDPAFAKTKVQEAPVPLPPPGRGAGGTLMK